ncbi:MAG: hypothetical protein KUA36_16485 [Desulfomicrobium sp.]|nr:hypothetical protein [Desulfomicrobium sp.]
MATSKMAITAYYLPIAIFIKRTVCNRHEMDYRNPIEQMGGHKTEPRAVAAPDPPFDHGFLYDSATSTDTSS